MCLGQQSTLLANLFVLELVYGALSKATYVCSWSNYLKFVPHTFSKVSDDLNHKPSQVPFQLLWHAEPVHVSFSEC